MTITFKEIVDEYIAAAANFSLNCSEDEQATLKIFIQAWEMLAEDPRLTNLELSFTPKSE